MQLVNKKSSVSDMWNNWSGRLLLVLLVVQLQRRDGVKLRVINSLCCCLHRFSMSNHLHKWAQLLYHKTSINMKMSLLP